MTTAIITKYLGATNHRPSRIKASTMASHAGHPVPSVTVSYDYGLGAVENHAKAAEALAQSLKWQGQWVKGDGATGNVYVNIGRGAADVSDMYAFAFKIAEEA